MVSCFDVPVPSEVIYAGIFLLILGFVVVAPRDTTPGSLANRNVRQGNIGIVTTSGHQQSERRSVAPRIVVGLVMIVAGIGLIALA
ncbi:MAG: hypothetical protein ABIR32_22580 [Ilumatobacteraceae bacterium]